MSKRALVVDDSMLMRRMIGDTLSESGWEVVAEACKQAGVLVRAFPGEGVRVTIGDPEPNETVLDVLSNFRPTN